MIDTIAFDLPEGTYGITKPELFAPNADILKRKPSDCFGTYLFPRSLFQKDKKKYYPQVSLYEYTQHPPRRIYLKVECSVPKFLKGENFFSIREGAMEAFARKMSDVLREMGVEVTQEAILSASVNKLHVAHNIVVQLLVSIILDDLARAQQPAKRDIQKRDFRNGGEILHLHYDQYELAFYDKVADMERLSHSPKRAICYDKFPELPVYKKYLEGKNIHVLRMELRLNTKEAIKKHWYPAIEDSEQLQTVQIKGLTVRDCFNEKIIQKMLQNQWKQLESSLTRLPAFRRNNTELFADIVRRNPDKHKKTLEGLMYIVMMLSQTGVRETMNALKAVYSEEEAKRRVKAALALNLPRYKPNYIAFIGEELQKFRPLTPETLMNKINKSIIKLNMDNPNFLTVDEMASILKVVPMTIYRYLKAGKLQAYKFGKEYRVYQEDFKAFVAACKVSPKKGGRK